MFFNNNMWWSLSEAAVLLHVCVIFLLRIDHCGSECELQSEFAVYQATDTVKLENYMTKLYLPRDICESTHS